MARAAQISTLLCWQDDALADRGHACLTQEQKAKQRHKEYERKREEKNRDRQMYIMRHTRDYEMLELPLGAARADVKAAYRHPPAACCSSVVAQCHGIWL